MNSWRKCIGFLGELGIAKAGFSLALSSGLRGASASFGFAFFPLKMGVADPDSQLMELEPGSALARKRNPAWEAPH